MVNPESIIFTARFDFYQDVLTWTFDDEDLSCALVDEAWSLYRDNEDDDSLYNERDDLAGDRYLTGIELDGPTVVVTIYDDWGSLEEDEREWLSQIYAMSHFEMTRYARFAPAGHPFFGGNAVATDAFRIKWEALGGMTTGNSKAVGWDEKQADNWRIANYDRPQ